ncbi:MAG: hypothetical protein WCV93_05655 [Candidatus Shapirobacteria bacterium]|jgi:hypothetical protein
MLKDLYKQDAIIAKYGSLGAIVTEALKYVYVIAGLMLLVWLIYGGITMMTAGTDQNKAAQGQGMITNAAIGFGIIFVSYFVVQIAEVVLGVKIL